MEASPPPEVRSAVAPLLVDPSSTALLSDFDGTLAPFVDDPAAAVLLPGAGDVLVDLAGRFGRVGVVSGRPVSFLIERLVSGDGVQLAEVDGARLVGLYGLEWSSNDGGVVTAPGAEQWRSVVANVVDRLRVVAPVGVSIEAKGLTVTVHWRQAPAMAEWVAAAVAEEVRQTGLVAHPGRMTSELRPPLAVDKGTATEALADGFAAVCFLGDDLGDLPAFHALDRLAHDRGLRAVTIAATDAESPAAVADAADVVVEGPQGALEVLRWLADQAVVDERWGISRRR